MDSGYNTIFDIIEILAGAYVIYSGFRMKNKKVLSSQLVGKDLDTLAPRDIEGFIKVMFPVYMVGGSLFLILGALSLYTDRNKSMPLSYNLTITGVLFLTCVVFALLTKWAQDKFLK